MLLIIIASAVAVSQDSATVSSDVANSSLANSTTDYYQTGFSKNINIFNFYNKLNTSLSFSDYKFDIIHAFSSTVLKLNEMNIKDEEKLLFNISKPIWNNTTIHLDNLATYSSDSRPIGNNVLSDYYVLPGISYQLPDFLLFKGNVGYNFNKRTDVSMQGMAYSTELSILDLPIVSDLAYHSSSQYRRTNYTNSRFYQLFVTDNSLESIIDSNNRFSLQLNYNGITQDYINFTTQTSSFYLFEQNNVRNLETKTDIKYSPISAILISGRILYGNSNRNREYNAANPFIKNSFYRRNSESERIQLELNSAFNINRLNAFLSTDYESNKEVFNPVVLNDSLPKSEVVNYTSIQRFNDFSSSKFRLNFAGLLQLRRADSLFVNLTASIFRYDTPFEGNNDDYDESYSALYSSYNCYLDKDNNFKVVFELKNRHNAFLKAEKSAQSNSLKTIRLASLMHFASDGVYQINPAIDIMANYNVYDFHLQGQTQNTYSFRQISYLDSAIINIDKNNLLNVNILLRYSERGFLNWDEFSEMPLKSNLEQLYRLMIYNNYEKYSFGIGVGFYTFYLNDLIKNQSDQRSYILSPESYIKYSISENSNIIFSGKYDFQNINGGIRQYVNASLKCELYL